MTRDETIDYGPAGAVADSPLAFAPDGDDPEAEIAPPGGESFGSLLAGNGKKRKKIPVLILDPAEALAAANEIQIIAAHDFANGNTPEWNEERLLPPTLIPSDEDAALPSSEEYQSHDDFSAPPADCDWGALPDPVAEAATPDPYIVDQADFWGIDWSDEPEAEPGECPPPVDLAEPIEEATASAPQDGLGSEPAAEPHLEAPGEWDWPQAQELPVPTGEAVFEEAGYAIAVPEETAAPCTAEEATPVPLPLRATPGHRLRAGLTPLQEAAPIPRVDRILTLLRRIRDWARRYLR